MTGAVAAAQYSVPAAVSVTVQLHDQYISDAVIGIATASYTIGNSGNVVGSPGGTLEAWLTGTGASTSNYEVMAVLTSGYSSLTGSSLSSWLNCGSSNVWTITNSARNNSVRTSVLSVQIRDVATHTVLASASITLSAESDNSFGG